MNYLKPASISFECSSINLASFQHWDRDKPFKTAQIDIGTCWSSVNSSLGLSVNVATGYSLKCVNCLSWKNSAVTAFFFQPAVTLSATVPTNYLKTETFNLEMGVFLISTVKKEGTSAYSTSPDQTLLKIVFSPFMIVVLCTNERSALMFWPLLSGKSRVALPFVYLKFWY